MGERRSNPLIWLHQLPAQRVANLTYLQIPKELCAHLGTQLGLSPNAYPAAIVAGAQAIAYRELYLKAIAEGELDLTTRLLSQQPFLEKAATRLADQRMLTVISILDIHGMHDLNTKYGYDRVTNLIRYLGFGLGSLIREGDLAGRYGGDEFVLCTQIARNFLPEHLSMLTQRVFDPLRMAGYQKGDQAILAEVKEMLYEFELVHAVYDSQTKACDIYEGSEAQLSRTHRGYLAAEKKSVERIIGWSGHVLRAIKNGQLLAA